MDEETRGRREGGSGGIGDKEMRREEKQKRRTTSSSETADFTGILVVEALMDPALMSAKGLSQSLFEDNNPDPNMSLLGAGVPT